MSADDGSSGPKMMRPNDLCTAAYYGDVEKLKELLTVEAVEEEPPLEAEFDPLAPPDEEGIAAAADRKARREANAKEIAKRLAAPRKLVTRLSPVNVQEYGFFVTAVESGVPQGPPFAVAGKFKASRRSEIPAAPLHWAVLGRDHKAIDFLIMQGADVSQPVPELGITVDDIVRSNQSLETERSVRVAQEAYRAKKAKEQEVIDAREKILHERSEMRKHALEEQRRKEEEERLAAEREAAGENAPAAPEAADADEQ